jgi:hypothetical protein
MEPGFLYVSLAYCTAMHLCVCGCGNEVVTPISPVDWQLKFNGKTISLSPSIGNWNFECRSHYWIINNEVRYSGNWSDEKVASGRDHERKLKDHYYGENFAETKKHVSGKRKKKKRSRLERFKAFFNFF